MKSFITKSVFFFLVMASFALALPLLLENKETSTEFMAAIRDKHKRLNNTPAPRLILAGGSNLVFGVDSQKLEQELQIPVINLGLRAHLGLNFILNEVTDVMQKDDVVLLSIEHFMDLKGDRNLHLLTSHFFPEATKYYAEENSAHWKTAMEYRLMLYKKTLVDLTAKGGTEYGRNDFNAHGDGTKHLTMPSPQTLGSRYIITSDKGPQIQALNRFYESAQKKGVKVFFSFSPYAHSEFVKNKKEVLLLDHKLRAALAMQVLTKAADFVYPEDHFFDNVYHLNKAGRDLHTAKLAALLKTKI